jgi:tetratricopeptide (TPR) repeat protein
MKKGYVITSKGFYFGSVLFLIAQFSHLNSCALNWKVLSDSIYSAPLYVRQKIEPQLQHLKLDSSRYKAFMLLAKTYELEERDYNLASNYYQKALNIVLNRSDTNKIFVSRNRLAWCAFYQGNYQEAFEYYHQTYTMLHGNGTVS